MAYQSYQTVYTAEGSLPALVVDKATGLELDCTLSFTAKFKLRPVFESGYIKTIPPAKELCEVAADELKMSYILLYPDGVPLQAIEAGRPDEVFNANAGGRVRVRFNIAFAVALDTLNIEKHSLEEADLAKIAEFKKMQRLCDPKTAAEEMRRRSDAVMEAASRTPGPDVPMRQEIKQNAPAGLFTAPDWICACGRSNSENFCRDCGRPRSYENWRCVCGAVNDGLFCTQCGTKRPGAD